jgi:hypothetical protein
MLGRERAERPDINGHLRLVAERVMPRSSRRWRRRSRLVCASAMMYKLDVVESRGEPWRESGPTHVGTLGCLRRRLEARADAARRAYGQL